MVIAFGCQNCVFHKIEQAAQVKYFRFPCAEHSNEPPKTEIMCTSGFHDFLSFISIAQKETFHSLFVLVTSNIKFGHLDHS